MGGKTTISTSETKIEALKLQSSAYGVTVPLVYGVNRIPGNLLWYGDFKATPHTTSQESGKGGGVKTTNTTYTYSASVAMGLCEGMITGVSRVWKGKEVYNGGVPPANIKSTTENFTMSGNITVANSAKFLTNVAVMVNTVPIIFGIQEKKPLTENSDYVVANGTYTFSNSAQVLYANKALSVTYQYQQGNDTQTALAQVGLSLKVGATPQSGALVLATYQPPGGNVGDQYVYYPGIAYVYAQDYQLGPGAQVENHTFEIQGVQAYSVSANVPDANPAIFVYDAITHGRYGAGFPSKFLRDNSVWANYCLASGLLMSPALTEQTTAAEFISKACKLTNTAPIWSGRALKFVPYGDSNLSANGATFTANVTPEYELNDNDYIVGSEDEPPVVIRRKPQNDAYNHVRIEFLDRANYYNKTIAEAKDTAAIEQYGIRTLDTIEAHWVCDANIARTVTQLVLQRVLFVRNEYTFKLPETKYMLEPMDIVTLTDSYLGLDRLAVRIVSIEESEEDDSLTIVAEDFPLGVASAPTYAATPVEGYLHNYNASPGNISNYVAFEVPKSVSGHDLAVYVGACGSSSDWGGCEVWSSIDGSNYKQMGIVLGGSRIGKLTGAISGGNLPVQMYCGTLTSGSANDANALSTLCYIGGSDPEFLAYQNATLTGNSTYNLNGLSRYAYSMFSVGNHAANDSFARVDASIAVSGPLDVRTMIGKQIKLKLLSFNKYGVAKQSLADVSEISYTVSGRYYYADVKNYDFTRGMEGWTGVASVTDDSTASGGKIGNITSNNTLSYPEFIPVDTSRVYRVTGRVKSATGGPIYMGVITKNASGQIIVNSSGASYAYCAAANINLTGDSQWYTFSGQVSGVQIVPTVSGDSGKFWNGTVQAAPLVFSYTGFNGTLSVDYLKLEDITDVATTYGLKLVDDGNCQLVGGRIVKVAGSSDWNAGMHSVNSYNGGAAVSFVITPGSCAINPVFSIGMSTANLTLLSPVYIKYGWTIDYSVGANIVVNGSAGNGTTFAEGDAFDVTHDGYTARWYKNGTLFSSQVLPEANALYLKTVHYRRGGYVDRVSFAPMSMVANLQSNQITPEAATTVTANAVTSTIQVTQTNGFLDTPPAALSSYNTIATFNVPSFGLDSNMTSILTGVVNCEMNGWVGWGRVYLLDCANTSNVRVLEQALTVPSDGNSSQSEYGTITFSASENVAANSAHNYALAALKMTILGMGPNFNVTSGSFRVELVKR